MNFQISQVYPSSLKSVQPSVYYYLHSYRKVWRSFFPAAYNKPVIFTTNGPTRTSATISTKKNGISVRNPISTLISRTPSEVKPCQRVLAGTLCEDDIDYPLYEWTMKHLFKNLAVYVIFAFLFSNRDAVKTLSKDDRFKSLYGPYFRNESMGNAVQYIEIVIWFFFFF